MKKCFFLLALLGLLTLTACYGASKTGDAFGSAADDYEYGAPQVGDAFEGTADDYEGVTMSIVEETAMPGGVTVEVLNTTEAEIDSGNEHDFGLQMEQGDRWYWLEPKRVFDNTLEAYLYSKDAPRELALTWNGDYGDLKPGHYRVTKWFFEHRGPGDTTDFLLTAEFTLE